ncbi:MAG: hypothetical protein HY673_06535 [Chloroflexi bacterium]|nr:hypothetical protein [Chloroflexota bacterium]
MTRNEIILNCIDEVQSGRATVHDCLTRYPYLKDELEPLLQITASINPVEATPSPEFKLRLRNRLLSETGERRPKRGIFDWLRPLPLLRRVRFSLVAIGLVPIFALGGTTVYAYNRSLPDETLYPLKRAVETIELSLTSSPESRAEVHLKLAERRADEIVTQTRRGRTPSAATVESAASEIDSVLKEIGQVKPEAAAPLLSKLSKSTQDQQVKLGEAMEAAPAPARSVLQQAVDTSRRGNLVAEITSGNSSFLSKSPSVSDKKLEETHFKLEGTVVSISGTTWNISGVLIPNVSAPPNAAASLNRGIKLEGVVRNGQVFIGKIETESRPGNEFKLRGIFGGTSPDGATWYVGGLAITRPQNVPVPTLGKEVTVEGVSLGVMGSPAEERGRGTATPRPPAPASSPAPGTRTATPAPQPTARPTTPTPSRTTPSPSPTPSPTLRPPVRTVTPEPAKSGEKEDDDDKRERDKDERRSAGGTPSPAPSPARRPTPQASPPPQQGTPGTGRSTPQPTRQAERETRDADNKPGASPTPGERRETERATKDTGAKPGPSPPPGERRETREDGKGPSGQGGSQSGNQGSQTGDKRGDSKDSKQSPQPKPMPGNKKR